MDYSQLGDRDIDALVLHEIYGNQAKDKDIIRAWLRGGFKYTTNPADSWPIIESNHIALHPLKSKGIWVALSHDHEYSNRDVNPLRAAMVTFLTWKGSFNA